MLKGFYCSVFPASAAAAFAVVVIVVLDRVGLLRFCRAADLE
jgi:hypothetical protein